MLLDNNAGTTWLTPTGRNTDEFVKLRLADVALVDRVRMQPPSFAADGPRDFEVWVSNTTADDAAFTRVLQATAAQATTLQEFTFPGGPVRARHLKLLVRNNHGGTSIRVAALEVPAMSGEGNILSLPGFAVNLLRAESPSLLENGSVVVTYSSATDINRTPAAMLSYKNTLPWITTAQAGQFAVVQLAGARTYDLEALKLSPTAGTDCVKDFELWVSNTTSEPSAFTLVLQGTRAAQRPVPDLPDPGGARTRPVHPLRSPHELRRHRGDRHRGTGRRGPERRGGRGASAASRASRSAPSWPSTTTRAPPGSPAGLTNQWVKVRMAGGVIRPVPGVSVLANSIFGPRDFQIRVSTTTADDAAFTTVHTGTLPASATLQEVMFAAPVDARYIQFFWVNAQPSASSIGVRELKVLGDPDAPTAIVLGVSSQSQPVTNALDIDPRTQPWTTVSGQNTNQWLKLRLPRGQSWLVDQVVMKPSDNLGDLNVAREFEVQLSNTTSDDAAFTAVMTGTLRNDATFQHFYFPPTQARYVRLLVKNNYGGAALWLQVFWLVSPQVGGTDARFLDRSDDRDSGGQTYAWDFGDGSTSTQRDPVHQYAVGGVYDVRLRVTDDGGLFSEHTIRYHASAPPQADFQWAPLLPNEAQSVAFTDLSHEPFGSTIFREWDWADGTARVLNQQAPSHVFQDDGAYAVTLRVAGETGLFSTATKTVTVANLPPVANAGGNLTIVWGKPWNVLSSATDPAPWTSSSSSAGGSSATARRTPWVPAEASCGWPTPTPTRGSTRRPSPSRTRTGRQIRTTSR